MNLKTLLDFMVERKTTFESEVQERAQALSAQTVIDSAALYFDPSRDAGTFKPGNTIELLLEQGHFTVRIEPTRMILSGSHGIEIKRYEGKEIEAFYQMLSDQTQEIRDIPF